MQTIVLVFLDPLGSNTTMFGMRFIPLKLKVWLWDWISLRPNLVLSGMELGEVNNFSGRQLVAQMVTTFDLVGLYVVLCHLPPV